MGLGQLMLEMLAPPDTILPEPGQPTAQLSELIRLTACKKAMHAISRWYRTVYIPWLVDSYDTHKDKGWLNSDPPPPKGTNIALYVSVLDIDIKSYTL